MSWLSSGLLLFFAAAVPATSLADDPPTQKREVVTVERQVRVYAVNGSNFETVVDQMRRKGPSHIPGMQRMAALTRAEFTWEYTPERTDGQCAVADVTVNARVTKILPDWRQLGSSNSEMRREWNRFLDALRLHERLHEDAAVLSADELGEVILATAPASDCRALKRDVVANARAVLRGFRAKNLEIDTMTGHGLTTGSVLNSPK